jgi:hypothetical protein
MEDFGLILNTTYWLTLRTEYTFFPEIFIITLKGILSKDQFTAFNTVDCLKQPVRVPLTLYDKLFFCNYLDALSKQTPAKVYEQVLFKVKG